MNVTSTILPIRPPLNPRPSSTTSLLKRRHDLSFDSEDSLGPPSVPKRRRTPIQQATANAIMDLSLLGPPLFESSNPRFANLGTPDKEWLANVRPSPSTRSTDGFTTDSTPMDSPVRMADEDMDMMDCDQAEQGGHEVDGLSAANGFGRAPAILIREKSDVDMGEEKAPTLEPTAGTQQKGKLGIVMGFRADCERCQRREPGHLSHWVRKS